MRVGDRRFNGILGLVTSLAVGLAMVVPVASAHAVDDPPAQPAAAPEFPWTDATSFTGLAPETAAASCWEVKQLHPASPSGAYWLLTPAMTAPAQFWCDQETDGGGWVKVGQGRQGWETNAVGRGTAASLRTADPAADSTTTQLPTQVVDELLNGETVNTLTDGVRVRRAANTDGTEWQEVRFSLVKQVGWFWSVGAGWPVSNWRIGSTTGSGGSSARFGSGNSTNIVDTNIGSTQGFTWSFSYGTGVAGRTAADSYLWSASDGLGGARPFSEVYIRPHLLNADLAYGAVPDTGTVKIERAVVPESNALANPWGVSGIAGSVEREGDVEVQDMIAIGNTMFVGGNFRYVQQNEAGAGSVEQPFLAAFNATTGQYIPSFRPTLNEAVLALAVTPAGRLAVGGKFTSVNGTPSTGFAVLDPSTGALAGPQASITNSSAPGFVRVETISASATDLYLGGSFTHTTGPTGPSRYTRNAARIDATTMMPNVGWRPEFNGTVLDTDVAADGSTTYFSGFFDRVGSADALSVAAVPTAGAGVPDAWAPTWSSNNMKYQRAIVRHGDRIYVGGSEHSLFSFDASSYERLTSHITNPKGDFQTLLVAGDFLYGGSHSNWFIYAGATQWPSVGTAWTRADTMGWINSWRMDGVASVSTFSPVINSRLGSGGWASAEAPNGTVWTGGDFVRARVQGGGSGWTGAFVRFGLSDGAAPNTPTNLRTTAVDATTVRLAWGASAGGVGTGGSYQIIRDDRVIATTTATNITVPLGGGQRYFVRAIDATGNASASTPVLTVPGGNRAPVPTIAHTVDGLSVAFDATGSTDDGSIVAYHWAFGDGATSTEPTATHSFFSGGTYEVHLSVLDDRGSSATAIYTLDLAQPRPTDAYGAAIYDEQPWAFWRLDERSGTLAADSATGQHIATYNGGVTQGVAGLLPGSTVASFDGANDQVVSNDVLSGPDTFSAEVWFNTTTTRGGKLIGFGSAPSGTSSSYDRHIYMQNDGKLVFGVYSSGTYVVTTPTAYNDGSWHHAVGVLSSEGMAFYVDGVLIGTNPQTVAQDYSGYWRLGGDTTWGSSSAYFAGLLDDAAIYNEALTAAQVANHYTIGTTVPNQAPVAEFSFTADYLTHAFDASASNDSDGTIAQVSWNFGDGTPEVVGAIVTHTYAAAGTYTVVATVTDDDGDSSTRSHEVVAIAPPNQAPTAAFTHVATYLDVTFDASSSSDVDGSIVTWQWNYGDGSPVVDGAAAGSHSYTTAGTYTVTLTVTDDDGDSATATQELEVEAAPNVEPLPLFSFTSNFLDWSFDGTLSSDPDGSIASVAWNFGDGTAVVTGTPAALIQAHSYTAAGLYTVSLTITDNEGAAATATRSITVTAPPPNVAPNAEFSYSATFLNIAVDGTSSSDSDGVVKQWAWDFGDGSPVETGTTATATHTYAAAGEYTVTLTVTDDDSATGSVQKTFSVSAEPVNAPPVAQFEATATDLGVALDGSASTDAEGAIATWAWDFGDGSPVVPGSTPTTTHRYLTAGTYTITLVVTDAAGATGTAVRTVTVSAPANTPPTASFTFVPTYLSVAFDASASTDTDGTVATVSWNFGDGTPAVTGITTTHDYATAGSFDVIVTVTDNGGAQATTTKRVTVEAAPTEPTTRQVLTRGSVWSYWYSPVAPASDWSQVAFNPSGWATGSGPVGYGSTQVVSNLNPVATTNDRPRAVYFRSTFDVTDASKAVSLDLSVIGDDGVIVYVNGVEVGRKNMPTGAVTNMTYATSARRVTVAQNDLLTVVIPKSLLVNGTNVISAETHVNYRGTPDVTFWATASLTELTGPAAPNQSPVAAFTYTTSGLDVALDAASSTDADGSIASVSWNFGDGSATVTGSQATHTYATGGSYDVTVTVTDDDGASSTATQSVVVTPLTGVPTTTQVLTRGSVWSYWYSPVAPASDWSQVAFNPSGWATGSGPVGYGSTQVVSNLNPVATTNDRPRAVYFRSTFDVTDASKAVSLDLSVIGDDGVIVYVNGVEVGRKNMPTGAVTNMTYATSARRVTVAQNDLLTVVIPKSLLVNGTNVISAETHVNYRGTPDVTFWATASLTELR